MEKPENKSEMDENLDLFLRSCFPSNWGETSWGLELSRLKNLDEEHLNKAKVAILAGLEKHLTSNPIRAALATNLTAAIPVMQGWLEKILTGTIDAKENSPSLQGELAYALYKFTNDESYTSILIDAVKKSAYSDLGSGTVSMLGRLPVTHEGISIVWQRLKKGRVIKDQPSWKNQHITFLKENIKLPAGEAFLKELPEDERKELVELISQSSEQLEKIKRKKEEYIRGRGRYGKEEINRFDEYIKIEGSPVNGLKLKHIWKGHIAEINTITWSPDGKYLASSPTASISTTLRDTVRIWNLELNKQVTELHHLQKERPNRYETKNIAWASDHNNQLAIGHTYSTQTSPAERYRIFLWSIEKEKLLPPIYDTDEYSPSDLLRLAHGDQFLLHGSKALQIINTKTNAKEQIPDGYPGHIESIALAPNRNLIAIGYNKEINKVDSPHEILFYDIAAQKVVNKVETKHVMGIYHLCWMPNQPILAAASADSTISIWDLRTNQQIALLEEHTRYITALSFSANGELMASKSIDDQLLCIWRTDTWEVVAILREPRSYGKLLAFHPSLPILASICKEEISGPNDKLPYSIRIWEFDYQAFLQNQMFWKTFNDKEAETTQKQLEGEFNEDLEYTRIGGSPIQGIQLHKVLKGHTEEIQQTAWSPNGRFLASASNDKTIRIWDEATEDSAIIITDEEQIRCIAWSPDGENLVYGSNQHIKMFDLTNKETKEILKADLQRLDTLKFSPDGEKLAVAYGTNFVQILEADTWKEIFKTKIARKPTQRTNIFWVKDGNTLIWNLDTSIIQSLDINSNTPLKILSLMRDILYCMVLLQTGIFSPLQKGKTP